MSATEELRLLLGADGLRLGKDISERHRGDWHVRAPDAAPLALTLPRSTEQVSAILSICHRHHVPVVPQGGLTGLAGGAVPIHGSVLLSLEHLRVIEELDVLASTMTVQAGVSLQAIQERAQEVDLFFPLDLGARGSCLIGGNISTNAGGNRVLRYGMARDLVLGVEAVLADGTIITSLNKMLKNNAGYDLKQLFIGSEGTLGIVTRAVLRLQPHPGTTNTALCAFSSFEKVFEFLHRMRSSLAGALSAFEVMWPEFYSKSLEIQLHKRIPLKPDFAAYVLVEATGPNPEYGRQSFDAAIEKALIQDIMVDAAVAQSIGEAQQMWQIRDAAGELLQRLSPVANFDVSIETSRIATFVDECRGRLSKRWRSAQTICFGHLADNNLHLFVTVEADPFPNGEIEETVYGCVRDWGGSISAEHGVGLLKKPFLGHTRSAAEIALMKTLKAALDPRGILNPGKIFDRDASTA
jgi:FAD/FMN-containing dehydrogenase